MIHRKLCMARLKPECLEEYREFHRHVWPELEAAYQRAGITAVSCFLHDTTLLIYSEYDPERYPASLSWLSREPVEQKWQALMRPLADPSAAAVEFEEVYRMVAVDYGTRFSSAGQEASGRLPATCLIEETI